MVLLTLGILNRTKDMEMVFKFGRMGDLTMDSGRIIKCMVRALSLGQMVKNTKDSIIKVKSTGKARLAGLMEGRTMEAGKTECKTVMALSARTM